jgi:hypothetical protein
MKEFYDEQKEANEKQQNSLKNNKSKEIARPNIVPTPTYTAKAPKK